MRSGIKTAKDAGECFYYLNAGKSVQVRQETERTLVNRNEMKLSMKRKSRK